MTGPGEPREGRVSSAVIWIVAAAIVLTGLLVAAGWARLAIHPPR